MRSDRRGPAAAARPGRNDAGFATAVVIAMTGLVLMIGAVTVGIASIVDAHRRSQAAADLAALAGATARQRGGDGCAAATTVAGENGARLVGCEPRGDDVVVRVAVRAPPLPGVSGDLVAVARAGPVEGG